MRLTSVAVLLLGTCRWAVGVEFSYKLEKKERKCFGEELAKQELLLAEFVADQGKKISVTVTDPHSQLFSDHHKDKIKTAFTTNQGGPHWMCVMNEDEAEEVTVKMNLLAGAQAKDYSKVAKKEHLEPLQVSVKRIQETLRNYHNNVLYMREREETMRQTNDSTAIRVIGFCLFNVILMIGVGGWQMLYFKRFFRSKKII